MNIIFDGLSRNVSPLMFNVPADVSILQFVQLCDPACDLTHLHDDDDDSCTQLLLT